MICGESLVNAGAVRDSGHGGYTRTADQAAAADVMSAGGSLGISRMPGGGGMVTVVRL